MIKLADYHTDSAFPAEMRTAERTALAHAFDIQKKKFLERVDRAYIWADLEKVNDKYLDYLAIENRALLYNSLLTPNVKRNLIQNSAYWHMKIGTQQVVEEILNNVFPENDTTVMQWYEYNGIPYHFKVLTNTDMDVESTEEFMRMIRKVKNARSRLDELGFLRNIILDLYQPGVSVLENHIFINWKG